MSAPGKVLLCGGYLVLEQPNAGEEGASPEKEAGKRCAEPAFVPIAKQKKAVLG